MKRPFILLATIVCALGSACTNDPARPSNVLPIQEVLSISTMSGIETPEYTVVLTPEAWASAWAAIFAPYAPAQKPPLPMIDFDSRIIVLAAAGLRGAQGFSFTIDEVRAENGTLQVLVLERWPFCGSLPALSAPVSVVSVPRVATTATFALIKQGPPACS